MLRSVSWPSSRCKMKQVITVQAEITFLFEGADASQIFGPVGFATAVLASEAFS